MREPLLACALALFSVAIGLFLAHRRSREVGELIGAFGQSAVLAGVALAGGAALFIVLLRSDAPFIQSPGFILLWVVSACVPITCAAYAVGVGSVSILRRYAFRGDQGATLLWSTIVVVGVVVLLVAPNMLRTLGSFATLTAAALCMVATGGILIIHGPATAQEFHRYKISGVFVVVLTMMWAMPHLGLGWLSDQQNRRGSLVESWWISFDLDSPGKPRPIRENDTTVTFGNDVQPAIHLQDDRTGAKRIGVLDLTGAVLDVLPPTLSATADLFSFDRALLRRVANRFDDDRLIRSAAEMRTGPERYDLLVISLSNLPPAALHRASDGSFLKTVLARLSADGVLLLLVPARNESVVSRIRTVATSQTGESVYWGVASPAMSGPNTISLFAGLGTGAESNAQAWSSAALVSLQTPESSSRTPAESKLASADEATQ